MADIKKIICKEDFEKICFIHIQNYHELLIMNIDFNLMGNVKYIEGYCKDTQKTMLIAIYLEGEQTEKWLEASEPGYDEYVVYSYKCNEIEALIEWFADEIEVEDIPEELTTKILKAYVKCVN